MVDIIKDNLDKIQDACKRHYIKSLYVFGSAIDHEKFTAKSDVDFLYQFKDDAPETGYADNFFDLKFYLENLLHTNIDLVAYDYLQNPYFIHSIEKSKQLIYEG